MLLCFSKKEAFIRTGKDKPPGIQPVCPNIMHTKNNKLHFNFTLDGDIISM